MNTALVYEAVEKIQEQHEGDLKRSYEMGRIDGRLSSTSHYFKEGRISALKDLREMLKQNPNGGYEVFTVIEEIIKKESEPATASGAVQEKRSEETIIANPKTHGDIKVYANIGEILREVRVMNGFVYVVGEPR